MDLPPPKGGGILKYTLENGKVITIPDSAIENNMKVLELTKEQAIDLWLEDNDYQENEEQTALDEKAKAVKIQHGAGGTEKRKTAKERIVKVSDEKQLLFKDLLMGLRVNFPQAEILKENKLIQIKFGGKTFKIDLIEQRTPKN